jgi:3-hydroxyisobutyrate dehydrogenase-like beta-hydroxyacid dehydrogenase
MSRKARKNVGLIGLGIIGTRVAAGLRAVGYQVYVWNRSAKPMPNFLGSPAEVADSAEVIQIFVSDASALFEVIESMGDALTPKHVIICNATVGPEAVLEAAQAVEARGAQFLDAPFTGSKVAAEKRELVYYIGGSDAAFLRAKPILEASSRSMIRIGAIGHASTVKVVTNMISAVTVQTLAEALSIVQKAGLEPEVLAAAIEQNACRSGVIDLKLAKMITGDYEPHFSLKHMFKDVQLGIHMANALDIEIPATTVTAGVMYGALNQGWADLDFSVLFKNYTTAASPEEFPALESGEPLETALEPPSPVENAPEIPRENGDATAPIDESLHESTGAAPAAGNGGIHESTPTEAAAKIIEAVLALGSGEREEKAASTPEDQSTGPEENQPAGNPPLDLAKEASAESEIKPLENAAQPAPNPPLSENALSVEAAAAAALADDSETSANSQNFVRRWFVPRSGG